MSSISAFILTSITEMDDIILILQLTVSIVGIIALSVTIYRYYKIKTD